jgi:hypothetical protein
LLSFITAFCSVLIAQGQDVILIFSSEENFLRVCLLMSLITASALFLGLPIV